MLTYKPLSMSGRINVSPKSQLLDKPESLNGVRSEVMLSNAFPVSKEQKTRLALLMVFSSDVCEIQSERSTPKMSLTMFVEIEFKGAVGLGIIMVAIHV